MKGGEFLIKEQDHSTVWVPENISEEQKMFREMAMDFIKTKVWPKVEEIDNHSNPDLVPNLIDQTGELGLLGAGLPQEYGGMELDFNSETILSEELGKAHSFGVSFAAHTGIGTLPLLFFGSEELKKKYLPDLATGKLKAAYCLTEPDSGSDALAAKSKAILSEDGSHYLLTGQKMWITNAGFADVLTVFAKVDGEHFTGFLVDAHAEGVSLGEEENKMGIKGSSTRQIFFENVKVPVDHILGEVGKGHKIAFNVLNIGRYKLGAMVTGSSKQVLDVAIKYANERKQFNVPISSFGAIKYKLAEMAIRAFMLESSVYRVSDLIQQHVETLVDKGEDKVAAKLKAAEEFSSECAVLKVFGSEVLDYITDEAVQIFGGTGFSEEYPVARFYRDSRINRIFEGTNEVNRMLAVGMLLRKAMKGQLDLLTPAMKLQEELLEIPDFGGDENNGYLAEESKAVAQAKKAILLVAGAAAQKYMMDIEKQQQLLMNVADMMIDVYSCESGLLRLKRLHDSGSEGLELKEAAFKVWLSDALERIYRAGKHAVSGFAEGDELRMMLIGVKRFTKFNPVNTIDSRTRIADFLISEGRFTL